MTRSAESLTPLLDAAITYARRGWPVFPCHTPRFPKDAAKPPRCSCGTSDCTSIGKHPRTVHGHLDGTTDEEVIGRWWARWPSANIGLVTGAASGLVVLDIDPRHGGDLSLENLEAEQGKLPDTVESLTGCQERGGERAHSGGPVMGTQTWQRPRTCTLGRRETRAGANRAIDKV